MGGSRASRDWRVIDRRQWRHGNAGQADLVSMDISIGMDVVSCSIVLESREVGGSSCTLSVD